MSEAEAITTENPAGTLAIAGVPVFLGLTDPSTCDILRIAGCGRSVPSLALDLSAPGRGQFLKTKRVP